MASPCRPNHLVCTQCLSAFPNAFTCPFPSCQNTLTVSDYGEASISQGVFLLTCSGHRGQIERVCVADECRSASRAVCSLKWCHEECQGRPVAVCSFFSSDLPLFGVLRKKFAVFGRRLESLGCDDHPLRLLSSYLATQKEKLLLMTLEQQLDQKTVYFAGEVTTREVAELSELAERLRDAPASAVLEGLREWSQQGCGRPDFGGAGMGGGGGRLGQSGFGDLDHPAMDSASSALFGTPEASDWDALDGFLTGLRNGQIAAFSQSHSPDSVTVSKNDFEQQLLEKDRVIEQLKSEHMTECLELKKEIFEQRQKIAEHERKIAELTLLMQQQQKDSPQVTLPEKRILIRNQTLILGRAENGERSSREADMYRSACK